MNLTEDLKNIEAMLAPKTISECASELDTQRTIIEAIDKDVVSHNEKLFTLTETVEEHIAQLAELNEGLGTLNNTVGDLFSNVVEHDENIEQLGKGLAGMGETTAKKFEEFAKGINANNETFTENIEYLLDEIDDMDKEILIQRVLIAVFGVLILWLMSRA